MISHVPCGGTFVAPPGELLITAELKQLDGPGGLLGQVGRTTKRQQIGLYTKAPLYIAKIVGMLTHPFMSQFVSRLFSRSLSFILFFILLYVRK